MTWILITSVQANMLVYAFGLFSLAQEHGVCWPIQAANMSVYDSFLLASYFVLILQVHMILDEIILGGQVLETNSSEIVKAVEEISK